MSLTEVQIRNAKAADKPMKLFDSGGLYLLCECEWESLVAIEVSLRRQGARDLARRLSRDFVEACARAARRLVAEGIDPSAERKASKLARHEAFQAIAEEWLALQAKTLGQ